MPAAPDVRYSIRRSTPADAAALAGFAETIFRVTFEPDNRPQDMDEYCRGAFGEEIQRRELLDPQVHTVLAISGSAIVGYGQVCLDSYRTAEIRRLYVDVAWQGRQLATALLRRLIDHAVSADAQRIWLGVWEKNPKAIRFYEKAGFIVVGDHPFMLGSDLQRDLVMQLAHLPSCAPGESQGVPMKRVTGIGGIFFHAKDPVTLREWYKKHLGIDVQDWGGTAFLWSEGDDKPTTGMTVWSIGAAGSDHFAPSTNNFMINYRVDDLAALLQALRDEGCNVLPKTDDSEFGKFGWVMDPEGNKVELWQPPAGQ